MDTESGHVCIIGCSSLYTPIADTITPKNRVTLLEDHTATIAEIKKADPHLILLDIEWTENGFDILRQIRALKDFCAIPVIVVSERKKHEDEEFAFAQGAVDYICKPIHTGVTVARINAHLATAVQVRKIEQLGFYDPLTNLPNRRKFNSHVEYEWNRAVRNNTGIGLIIMDLDDFKAYNDRYGHIQGDRALQAVALTLRATLRRSTDVPCRWGGEEFAVLLPDATYESICGMANKIHSHIEKLGNASLTNGGLTASFGAVSVHPHLGDSISDVIDCADSLLYEAKRRGKNQVQTCIL